MGIEPETWRWFDAAPRRIHDTAHDHCARDDVGHVCDCARATARIFVDDGEFSVSQEWGVAGNKPIKGRAALIEAAGGDGKGGCKDPKTQMGYGISHIVANHVILPSPEGATGKSYLLAIGVGGDPTTIERQGGYEDVYVKTRDGWRFKSRVHVFPNLRESVQFGPRGRGRAGTPPPQNAPAQPAR